MGTGTPTPAEPQSGNKHLCILWALETTGKCSLKGGAPLLLSGFCSTGSSSTAWEGLWKKTHAPLPILRVSLRARSPHSPSSTCLLILRHGFMYYSPAWPQSC